MDQASKALAELSSLRWAIETAQRVSTGLFESDLIDESAQVLEASVQLGKVYIKLVELASKPPAAPTMKHAKRRVNQEGEVPF